ncbi:30S ribosomal protein S20 [Pontibacter qinzhouensis]|uniref:Small ribosomal subunit protein bS20 n=1 Tax=Pontibacter qinzhouensis TaxID=2603253 RepID=A0A5C8K9W1_9BACT|nr:30S ribosomal protein S20 [Pontibacter qinzhouensis]TXK45914.1 30S ribosomal protein S20 [Pontibacter qinzhouensis]
MANHKSALKRIRANNAKRLRNRYQAKTTRTFIKRLKNTTDQAEAQELYKTVASMIDRLAKKNIIHKNKASNNKSKLAKHVNSLAAAA